MAAKVPTYLTQKKFNTVGMCVFSQIRMQAQGRVIQGSMMGTFINIYQEEGTRGLWKVAKTWGQKSVCLWALG